jgi:hypothetical protein
VQAEDLLERVKDLRAAPLDPALAESVRRRARAALERERGLSELPRLLRAAARLASPALVTSAVALYLFWAARFVASLAR